MVATSSERAIKHLDLWTDLRRGTPSCRVGQGLHAGNCEIVHFHSHRTADLHLTTANIRHLHSYLEQSDAIRLHDDSPWVTIDLDAKADVDLLITLASVALKAHAQHVGDPAHGQQCNLDRSATWYILNTSPTGDPRLTAAGPKDSTLSARS